MVPFSQREKSDQGHRTESEERQESNPVPSLPVPVYGITFSQRVNLGSRNRQLSQKHTYLSVNLIFQGMTE